MTPTGLKRAKKSTFPHTSPLCRKNKQTEALSPKLDLKRCLLSSQKDKLAQGQERERASYRDREEEIDL